MITLVGADGSQQVVVSSEDGKATLPSGGFARDGFDLVGWASAEGSTAVEYALGQTIEPASDMTLFAVWAPEASQPSATDGEGASGAGYPVAVVRYETASDANGNGAGAKSPARRGAKAMGLSAQNATSIAKSYFLESDGTTAGKAWWKFDAATGTLTIGTDESGATIDSYNAGGNVPWRQAETKDDEGNRTGGGIDGFATNVLHVVFDGIVKPFSMESWFNGFSSVEDFTWGGLDTSACTNFSNMFNGCSSVENLNATSFKTQSAENVSGMFSNMTNLAELNISGWDLSSVTNAGSFVSNSNNLKTITANGVKNVPNGNIFTSMFRNGVLETLSLKNATFDSSITSMQDWFSGMTNLQSLDVSGWDVSGIANMQSMFSNCQKLETLTGLSGWNVSAVENFNSMFYNNDARTGVDDVKGWKLDAATNIQYMFNDCDGLTTVDLSAWRPVAAVYLDNLFANCKSLASVDLSGWNLKQGASVGGFFSGASALTDITLKNWTVHEGFNGNSLFSSVQTTNDAAHAVTVDVTGWKLDGVKSTASWFNGRNNWVKIKGLASWDMGAVTDASYMFANFGTDANFAGTPYDVSTAVRDWDVSSVTNLSAMFYNNDALSKVDLSNWNMKQGVDVSSLFSGSNSLTNIVVKDWTVHYGFAGGNMFGSIQTSADADREVTIDASGWTLDGVTSANAWLAHRTNLVSLDVSNWTLPDTLTDMGSFLYNDPKLSDVKGLDTWDVSKVQNLSWFFYNNKARAGVDDIKGWDLAAATNLSSMFNECDGLTTVDLSTWRPANVVTFDSIFANCDALSKVDLSNWDLKQGVNVNSFFSNSPMLTDIVLKNWTVHNGFTGYNLFSSVQNITTDTDHAVSVNVTDWKLDGVTSTASWFQGRNNWTSIKGLASWNTGNVTDMNQMFRDFGTVTTFPGTPYDVSDDIKEWDVSSVTNFWAMFHNNDAIESFDLSKWDVSSATNMTNLFSEMSKLQRVDLSNWNMKQGVNVGSFFSNSNLLTDIVLRNWTVHRDFNGNSLFSSVQNITTDTDHAVSVNVTDWKLDGVTSTANWFQGRNNWTSVKGLASWDTSNVTDMHEMFRDFGTVAAFPGIPYDVSDDIKNWKTGNVTNFWAMFYNNDAIESFDLSKWDVSSATSVNNMFGDMNALTNVDLSNWNMRQGVDVNYMFSGSNLLTDVTMRNWTVHAGFNGSGMFGSIQSSTDSGKEVTITAPAWKLDGVTTVDSWFSNRYNLVRLDVSYWEIPETLTNMNHLFYDCRSLPVVDGIETWDMSNVTSMYRMFYNNDARTTTDDINNWKLDKVQDFQRVFEECDGLVNVDLSTWRTPAATNFNAMFLNCRNLETLDISNWDASHVGNLMNMFDGNDKLHTLKVNNWVAPNTWDDSANNPRHMWNKASLTTVEFENWDLTPTTTLQKWFYQNKNITDYSDLESWDVSHITNMREMFRQSNISSLAPISEWDVSKVADMGWMFAETEKLQTLKDPDNPASGTMIGDWDVSTVQNMEYLFYRSALKSADLSGWGKSGEKNPLANVSNYNGMFQECSSLESVKLSDWDIRQNAAISNVFASSNKLTDIDLDGWTVHNGFNGYTLFSSVQNVTPGVSVDVTNWHLDNITDMNQWFRYHDNWTEIEGLSTWDTSTVTNMADMFADFGRSNTQFSGAYDVSADLVEWDVSRVTSFYEMFYNNDAIVSPDFSKWDVSSGGDFYRMFAYADSLKAVDLSNWNLKQGARVSEFFSGSPILTDVTLKKWKVQSGFRGDELFSSIQNTTSDIDHAVTVNVTDWTLGDEGSYVTSTANWFAGRNNWQMIKGLSTWDMSHVTTVNRMFADYGYDTNFPGTPYSMAADIAEWNMGAVTDFSYMFYNNDAIPSVDFSKWNVSSGTNFNGFLQNCNKLTAANLENWNISQSASNNVYYFFSDSPYLANIDLKNWTVHAGFNGNALFSSVQNYATNNAWYPVTVDVTDWTLGEDGSYVTTTANWFQGRVNWEKIDGLSTWDTGKVTSMNSMFAQFGNNTSFAGTPYDMSGDVAVWNTSSVYDFGSMFYDNDAISVIDFSTKNVAWDVSNATSINSMFRYCDNLERVTLEDWDVAKITNTDGVFLDDPKLKTLILNRWQNVKNSLNAKNVFNTPVVEYIEVANWDTDEVTSMYEWFAYRTYLDNLDLHTWDTSNVTDMGRMFDSCKALETLNVSNLNTSKVTSLYRTFSDCESLAMPTGLSGWNTSSVTSLQETFQNNKARTTFTDVKSWDTSSNTSLYSTFNGNTANTMDLGKELGWNISNVTNAWYAFYDNTSMTLLDLTEWDTAKFVNSMGDMLNRLNALNTFKVGPKTVLNTNSNLRGSWVVNSMSGTGLNLNGEYQAPMLLEAHNTAEEAAEHGTVVWVRQKYANTMTTVAGDENAWWRYYENDEPVYDLNGNIYKDKNGNNLVVGDNTLVIGLYQHYNNGDAHNQVNTGAPWKSSIRDGGIAELLPNVKHILFLNGIEPITMKDWFSGMSGLKSVGNADELAINTSYCTDMRNVFNGCTNLSSLDLSTWNTSPAYNTNVESWNAQNYVTSLKKTSGNHSGSANSSFDTAKYATKAERDSHLSEFQNQARAIGLSNAIAKVNEYGNAVTENMSYTRGTEGMFTGCNGIAEIVLGSNLFFTDNFSIPMSVYGTWSASGSVGTLVPHGSDNSKTPNCYYHVNCLGSWSVSQTKNAYTVNKTYGAYNLIAHSGYGAWVPVIGGAEDYSQAIRTDTFMQRYASGGHGIDTWRWHDGFWVNFDGNKNSAYYVDEENESHATPGVARSFVASDDPINLPLAYVPRAKGGEDDFDADKYNYYREDYYLRSWIPAYSSTRYEPGSKFSRMLINYNGDEITLVADWVWIHDFDYVFAPNGDEIDPVTVLESPDGACNYAKHLADAEDEGSFDGWYTTVMNGKRFVLPENWYVRPGWDFAGWLVEGTLYQPGAYAELTFPDTETQFTRMISAYWTPKSGYVIHYDLNGGTLPVGNESAFDDALNLTWITTGLISRLGGAKPVKPGFSASWYYDKMVYDAEKGEYVAVPVQITDSTYLREIARGVRAASGGEVDALSPALRIYALYTEDEVRVYYVADQGHGAVRLEKPYDSGANYEQFLDLSEAPVGAYASDGTGYKFVGWMMQGDESRTVITTSRLITTEDMAPYAQNPATMVWSDNITFIALFDPIDYAVRFDAGEGTPAELLVAAKYDAPIALGDLRSQIIRPGYSIEKYIYTSPEGVTTEFGATDSPRNLTADDGTVLSFKVVWKEDLVKFTFTVSYAMRGNVRKDGGAAASQVVQENIKCATGEPATMYAVANPGYRFSRWLFGSGSDQRAVTYMKDGVETLVGATLAAEHMVRTADGVWFPDIVGNYYTAVFEPNTYTVVYDGNGTDASSAGLASQTLEYGTPTPLRMVDPASQPPAYTRTGYKFIGWSTDKDKGWRAFSPSTYNVYSGDPLNPKTRDFNNGQTVSDITTVNGDTVALYAVWQPIAYTVRFNPLADVSGRFDNMTVEYGAETALPQNRYPSDRSQQGWIRNGYTLVGWTTDRSVGLDAWNPAANAGRDYALDGKILNLTAVDKATVDLYAIWQMRTDYTATFVNPKVAFGSFGGTDTTAQRVVHENLAYGSAAPANDAPANYAGVTEQFFSYWDYVCTLDDGRTISGKVVDPTQVSVLGELTFTAVWDVKSYIIQFVHDGNGGFTLGADGDTFFAGKRNGDVMPSFAQRSGQSSASFYDTRTSNPCNIGGVAGKVGYFFTHWTWEADGVTYTDTRSYATDGVVYSSIPLYVGKQDYTFVAHFKASKNILTFDLQKGKLESATRKTVEGHYTDEQVKLLDTTEVKRAGADFLGWSLEAGGPVRYVPGEEIAMFGEDTTLFAAWKLRTYVLHFDSMGGTAIEDKTGLYWEQQNLLEERVGEDYEPYKPGHVFMGWYLSLDQDIPDDIAKVSNSLMFEALVLPDAATGQKSDAEGTEAWVYAFWVRDTTTLYYKVSDDKLAERQSWGATSRKTESIDAVYGRANGASVTVKPGYHFRYWLARVKVVDEKRNETFVDMILNDESSIKPTKDLYGDILGDSSIWYETTFYAVCAPATYIVRFDANGGEGYMPDQSVECNKWQSLSAVNGRFTREGYEFEGWTLKADGTGAMYGDAASVYNLATEQDAVVTLFAKWKRGKFTLTIDANGGSGSTSIQEYAGAKVKLPGSSSFSRTGYMFDGFAETSDGVVAYPAATAIVMPAENTTLYAHWTPIKYVVNYHALTRKVTANMSPQLFTYGVPQRLSKNLFENPGYVFLGWSTTAGAKDPTYVDSQLITTGITTRANEQVNLYAVWQRVRHAVSYEPGEHGAFSARRFEELQDGTDAPAFDGALDNGLPAGKDGYIFVAWMDSNGAKYAFGAALPKVGEANDGVYTAIWDDAAHKLHYDLNGLAAHWQNDQDPSEDAVESGSKRTLAGKSQALRPGSELLGWAESAKGPIVYAPGMADFIMPDRDVNLFAIWNELEYTVVFVDDDNYVPQRTGVKWFDTGYVPVPDPQMTGRLFKGWFTQPNGGGAQVGSGTQYGAVATAIYGSSAEQQSSITLYGYWVSPEIPATLYFEVGEGEGTVSPGKYELSDAYRGTVNATIYATAATGYAFVGWFTSAGELVTTSYYFTPTKGSGEMWVDGQTWLARFAPVTYIVRFDGNGATSGTMNDDTRTYGEGYSIPKAGFDKDGYELVGWRLSGTDTVYAPEQGVSEDWATNQNAAVTLTAIWEAKLFKLTFDGNGATSGAVADELNNQFFSADSYPRLLDRSDGLSIVRNGYTLDGWNDFAHRNSTSAQYGLGTSYQFRMPGADTTLYAHWKPIVYYIAFDKASDQATGYMSTMTFTYDEVKALNANTFYRPGYVFDGWELPGSDGQSTEVADGELVSNRTYVNGATVVAKAVWKTRPLIVHFNSDDVRKGVILMDATHSRSQVVEPGEYVDASQVDAVPQPGYYLRGWTYTADFGNGNRTSGSIDANQLATIAIYGDYVFTAIWSDALVVRYEDAELAVDQHGAFTAGVEGATKFSTVSRAEDAFLPMYDGETALYFNGATVLPKSSGTWYFVGWKLDGTDTVYYTMDLTGISVRSVIAALGRDASSNEPIVLRAVWSSEGYNVVYIANAGDATGEMATTFAPFDVEVGLSANKFQRDGYEFVGWSLTRDGGEGDIITSIVRSNPPVRTGARINVYAIWKKLDVTVHVGVKPGQGGSVLFDGAVQPGGITYTVGYGEKFVATGDGGVTTQAPSGSYALNGWEYVITNWNGTMRTGDAQVLALVPTNGKSVEVYPVWGRAFKVTYLPGKDGARGASWNVDEASGAVFTGILEGKALPYFGGNVDAKGAPVATDDNWMFAGWQDAQGAVYTAGAVRELVMGASDMTFTALWKASRHTVRFSANGGSAVSSFDTFYGRVGASVDDNGKDVVTPDRDSAIRNGYVLMGWNAAPDGSGEHYGYAEEFTIPDFDLTLYAEWAERVVSVYYRVKDASTGSIEGVEEYADGVWRQRLGAATGGQPDSESPTGVSGGAIAAKATAAPGYHFDHWEDANGNVLPIGSEYLAAIKDPDSALYVEGSAYYAVFAENDPVIIRYIVSNAEAGYVPVKYEVVNPVTGDEAQGTTVYAYAGWNFLGWWLYDGNDKVGGMLSDSATWAPARPETGYVEATYIAMFEEREITAHTVSYEYAQDSFVPAGAPAVPASYELKWGEVGSVAEPFVYAGYIFIGWRTEDVIVNEDGDFVMPDSDVTFVGYWAREMHTITFDLNHPEAVEATEGKIRDVSNYTGTEVYLYPASYAMLSGYYLAGWATEDGSTVYEPDSTIFMPGYDMDLFAVWKPMKIEVRFIAAHQMEGVTTERNQGYLKNTGGSAFGRDGNYLVMVLDAVTGEVYDFYNRETKLADSPWAILAEATNGYHFVHWYNLDAAGEPVAAPEEHLTRSFTWTIEPNEGGVYEAATYVGLFQENPNAITKYIVQGLEAEDAEAGLVELTRTELEIAPATGRAFGVYINRPSEIDEKYEFAGWYLALVDENGEFVLLPNGEIALGDKMAGDADAPFLAQRDPSDGLFHSATYIAQFKLVKQVRYFVKHYFQREDGTWGDVEDELETLYGEYEEEVTAQPLTRTGFAVDYTVDGTVRTGTLADEYTAETADPVVLALYYTRAKYTVTFAWDESTPGFIKDNVALPEGYPAEVPYGTIINLSDDAYIPAQVAGYRFLGWSTTDVVLVVTKADGVDGNGLVTTFVELAPAFEMPNANVTLVGVWMPLPFTVKFEVAEDDADKGEVAGSGAVQRVYAGAKPMMRDEAGNLCVIVLEYDRSVAQLYGWNYTVNGIVHFTLDPSTVEINEDTTFIARWVVPATVRYLTGEHGAFDEDVIGETYFGPLLPSHNIGGYYAYAGATDDNGPLANEGWKFAGWMWTGADRETGEPALFTTVAEDSDLFAELAALGYRHVDELPAFADRSYDFTAAWVKILATVTYSFNADGGSWIEGQNPNEDSSISGEVQVGTKIVLPGAVAAREGYHMIGWSLSEGATEPEFLFGDEFTVVEGDIVFYAVWEQDGVIKIEYRAVNGSIDVENGYVESETLLPSGTAVGSKAVANNGYRFLGWVLLADVDAVLEDGDLTKIVGNDLDFVPSPGDNGYEAAVYVALFIEGLPVTIRYIAGEGGSVTRESEVIWPLTGPISGSVAVAGPGYTFSHWVDSKGNKVMIIADGVLVAAGENLVPQKVGGAYLAETYTAVFEPGLAPYRVNYICVDPSGNEVFVSKDHRRLFDDFEAPIGSTVNGTPIKIAGFTYDAGYNRGSFVTVASAVPLLAPLSDGSASTVLSLVYTMNIHQLSFDLQDGSEASGYTVPAGSYAYNDEVILPGKDQVVLEGYVLSGWRESDGDVVYGAGSKFYMPDSDMELVAVWTAREDLEYTVNYYSVIEGNYRKAKKIESVSGKRNDGVTGKVYTLSDFFLDIPGYKQFLKALDRDGNEYTNGDSAFTLKTDGSFIITLYYAPNLVTVKYGLNTFDDAEWTSDPGQPADFTQYVGTDFTLAGNDVATRYGYDLVGWSVFSEGVDENGDPVYTFTYLGKTGEKVAVPPTDEDVVILVPVWKGWPTKYVVDVYTIDADGTTHYIGSTELDAENGATVNADSVIARTRIENHTYGLMDEDGYVTRHGIVFELEDGTKFQNIFEGVARLYSSPEDQLHLVLYFDIDPFTVKFELRTTDDTRRTAPEWDSESDFEPTYALYEGETIYLQPATDAITRKGYRFIGWSLDPDGSVILDVDELTMLGEDMVIYAVWEPNEVDVSFEGLGEYNNRGEDAKYYETDPVEGEVYVIPGVKVDDSFVLPDPTDLESESGYFRRLGWTFIGWYLKPASPSVEPASARAPRMLRAGKMMVFLRAQDADGYNLLDPGTRIFIGPDDENPIYVAAWAPKMYTVEYWVTDDGENYVHNPSKDRTVRFSELLDEVIRQNPYGVGMTGPDGYVFTGTSLSAMGMDGDLDGETFRSLIALGLLGELDALDDNSVPLRLYALVEKIPDEDKPGNPDGPDDPDKPKPGPGDDEDDDPNKLDPGKGGGSTDDNGAGNGEDSSKHQTDANGNDSGNGNGSDRASTRGTSAYSGDGSGDGLPPTGDTLPVPPAALMLAAALALLAASRRLSRAN